MVFSDLTLVLYCDYIQPFATWRHGLSVGLTQVFLAEHGVSWPPRMALGSNEALKHAVLAGLGLAVLSRHTLGPEPERVGLVELRVTGFPIRRMWHFVWRRDRRLTRPAQAFLDDLRQRLGGLTVGAVAKPLGGGTR